MWKATWDGCGIMFDGATNYILGNGDLGMIQDSAMIGDFIVAGVHEFLNKFCSVLVMVVAVVPPVLKKVVMAQ
eukprot:9421150-Ditylum_brightwellii.AAC.1